ncbi:MAG: alpha/beta fold hydrolase [Actinobacteria bacterium]|nr:MAG: alpha/beta fold hydrolase [Actinomycetota bacterium]
MTISEQIPNGGVAFRRRGEGATAVVFVHGFLDDQSVWDTVIDELTTAGIETIQLDLAGLGERAGASGPFTYDQLAAEVGAVVDGVGKPFVIVGQSMGAPIAELVATARPERALGLVLLTPVPLAGTRLPDDVVEPFRSLGADAAAQRGVRRQLSVALSDADLDRLVSVGLRVRPEVVRALVDCWNAGLDDAPEPSRYAGPVLIVRGSHDGFVTEDLVATAVSPRFASAQTLVIERAGHWPHVEQPAALAAQLDGFLTEHATGADDNTAADVRPQGWTNAFASKSADAFGEAFADDVVLEASVLTRPVEGRDQVMRVMGTASGIYESLVFTQEASAGRRSYLEWEATAFGGMVLRGVTVLTKDADGRIVRAAIHHRPLGAALRFSAELGERLTEIADHFYDDGGLEAGGR